MNITPGSKLRYPDLVVSHFRATLAVHSLVSCPKFPPPTSGTCLTSPLRVILASTLYGGWPTLFWKLGRSWNFCKSKGNNKVENKLEGLVGLVLFVVFTLSSSPVIWFLNGLVTPPSWDPINFMDDDSFLSPSFSSSVQRSATNVSGGLPPWGGPVILVVCLGPLFNYSLEF